jgi:hypothetical protein
VSIRSWWRSSATGWRLANGRVRASNAWYRTVGRRMSGSRIRFSNWRHRRAMVRGRVARADRWVLQARSHVPVYRDRINRATGRPHRDDGRMARMHDESLAGISRKLRQAAALREQAQGRAAGNQYFVRAKLADRQPQYVRTLDRAVRDLSPRAGRGR